MPRAKMPRLLLRCEQCGEMFTPLHPRSQRYCSKTCRILALKGRIADDRSQHERKPRFLPDLEPVQPVSMRTIEEKFRPFKYLLD